MSTSLLSTVTEYEEKALDLLVKLQDDLLGYVKQAVELLDQRLPELQLPEVAVLDQVPTLEELVNTQFAFSKKVLASQERFAKNVVETVKPLTREAEPKVTKTTTKAA